MLVGGEFLADRVQLSGGGGEGEPPQTFSDAQRLLGPMVAATERALTAVPAELRARRLVFEATVLPNYLANSHYPAAFFDAIGVVPVGTRTARGMYITPSTAAENAPAKTYVLSGDDDAISRIGALLERRDSALPDRVRQDVTKLQEIATPTSRVLRLGQERFIEIDGRVAMEVVINPIVSASGRQDLDDLRDVLGKWRDLARRLGGVADLAWVRSHDVITFLPTLLPRDRLEDAALFNPLRTLRPMPRLVVAPDGPLRAIGGARLPAPSAGPTTTQRIAIFDGTVAETVPALDPYVTREDLTGGAPDDTFSTQHATTVASAVAFGNIDGMAGLPEPPAIVDSYRVWPPPADQGADKHMYWVLDQIVAELNRREHRIVNLSLGPEFTVDDDTDPHRWTAALDSLAASRGILFCVAAGNTGEEDPDSGANRLGIPADLINGLSVGACDRPPPAEWHRAPYSSIGPGRPGARVAPQVLACGGHLPDAPFGCLIPGGQLAHSEGTSLAAPALARSLAELAHALGDRASLNTLRAAAVHFAERDVAREPSEVGYGRVPASFVERLTCAPNEATILYEDTLRRAQTMMLRVPIPEALLEELGGRYVRLRWTLTFTSLVDATDPVDYSRAGVTAFFRPNAERFNLNLSGVPPISVDRRAEPDFYNYLVREGRAPSDRPITRGLREYAPETERRQDGKWETTIRIDDRMQASTLYRPAFDVHLLTRQAGVLTPAGSREELDYSLLVTVTAPAGVALYDAVRADAPVLAPLGVQQPVQIQT
jgi:hypothetical protein